MFKNISLYIVIVLLQSQCVFASDKSNDSKTVKAFRVNETIVIDGILKEKVYNSPSVSDFTQRDPDEGKPATEKTEVWVFYDEHNFYVSAKLYDSRPDSISKLLGRRDQFLSSDYFGVAIDTYFDKRNAFFFLVNPSGSIVDGQFFNDGWDDETWDGVWEYGTSIFDSGWCVEIKIPFSQLRFKKADEQIWGINFFRIINRKKEEVHFVYVPKKESGFVSHFATLTGITGIKQKQRIEFLPYVVGKAQYLIHDPADPFYKSNQYLKNFGTDFKIGIGSNLTIDGTINPDFGQVEVDPAVINLTAFETFYREKRPFFIEGSNLLNFGVGGSNNFFSFNWPDPRIFYSRRIGKPPRIPVKHEGFVNYPKETRILGAAKLSGKITNSWSVNFINALTERTYATIDSSSIRFEQEIEPLTYYGLFRTQKEFNSGNQSIGFIAGSVIRDIRDPYIDSKLVRNSFTYGVDGWTYLDENQTYVLTGYVVGSYQKGSRESIRKLQEAPQRYFQRPDAKRNKLDTMKTEFSGYAGRFTINKQKGNFFLNTAFGFITPEFETNDLGFQYRSDLMNAHLALGYNWFVPDGITRMKSIMFSIFGNSDFEGNPTNKGFMIFGRVQFLNFYSARLNFGYAPQVYQKDLTRGGPLTIRPDANWFNFNFESDERKNLVVEVNFRQDYSGDGSKSYNSELSFEWKPNSQINFSFTPTFEFNLNKAQWISNVRDSFAVHTYGVRYIFGELLQRTFSTNIRLNWTFTPKLTLQLFAQPLFSVGAYSNLKELKSAGTYDFIIYGKDNGSINRIENDNYEIDPDGNGPGEKFTISNPDFNFISLRTNVVLRWEFLPGSALYFAWTHDQTNSDNPGRLSFGRDLKNLLRSDTNDIFLIKLTYWIDV